MRAPLMGIVAGTLCAGLVSAQEFTTLKGHGGPIMGLAVDGAGRVASASFDNSVGLWQGRVPRWLDGHDAAVTALALGTGGVLVSGGDDFAVRQWVPEERVLGQHAGKVAALAISPDGQWVASGGWDGAVHLWPLGAGVARELPRPGAGVNDLGFSEDGGTLYAATQAGALMRYELAGEAVPLPLLQHGFGINQLVVTGEWIAYGAVDGGTRVIGHDGAEIADFTLDRRPILSLDHHAESGQLAVGDGQGYIMILDTESWQIARDFRAMREGPVWSLAFSGNGEMIYAGGIEDVIYGWPVALLDTFEPAGDGGRSFLRDPETMPNGERQFMRKCSICHTLEPGPSRRAGPTLAGVFGRRAGTVPGYGYSPILQGSDIIWDDASIDALFDSGPDHYIPGSKMPMQVIQNPEDRADLIAFLKQASRKETQE
ncbi:c-type cytochrome [Roseovarius nubinhibens]|uniref:Cytochrome C n=1 Tax=Roseovarius nubinhibens TaxID=314263 RepID=A0A348WCU8_9RHOB|nr:cytochrome C [Roseovarius nubinhibens]|tara:strand:- start:715 stop:2001 length:1287 start_codon:yes stop_codon:yes gene_type:complete